MCIAPDDRAEVAQAGDEALGIVVELVERQLPAVARVGDEALHDAEGGVHQLALVLVPAAELGDVGEPALAEEAQHLELGVVARLDATERLQHERVVEDDRGVGLLGADGAHLRPRAAAARRPRASGTRRARARRGPRRPRAAGRRAARRRAGRRTRRRR